MLLETARLRLRRFRPKDAPAFAAYRSDPAVARYQGWSAPVSPQAAAALVQEFAAGEPDNGSDGSSTRSSSGPMVSWWVMWG